MTQIQKEATERNVTYLDYLLDVCLWRAMQRQAEASLY